MAEVIILAGANLGDPEKTFLRAEQLIGEQIGPVLERSSVFKSEPWGFDCELPFSNIAYRVQTSLPAQKVLECVLEIEQKAGRDRKQEAMEKERSGQPYASRVLDLDIMFYGRARIHTPSLEVPHPRILQREFAIKPLMELMRLSLEELKQMIKKIENEE